MKGEAMEPSTARKIEVGEISDMAVCPLTPLEMEEYPSELHYEATEILCLLGITADLAEQCEHHDYVKRIKETINKVSVAVFKRREEAQTEERGYY